MTGIINLISSRLDQIDFSNPLALLDLSLAVLIVASFSIYVRRYPIFQILLGVLLLLAISGIFLFSGLIITALLFGVASNLILISLPLIFAPEIRHYLEKLGRFPFLKLPKLTDKQKKMEFINNLVEALFEMAERKIGATIVIQRNTGLGETIETGIIIDAHFGAKILQSIFFPKSPLHDGAVIVNRGIIVAAGCLLPLHPDVKLDTPFGTRHKSAISITQDTDAVSIIVSEQRGQISLAENGKFYINLERTELKDKLIKLL